MKWVKTVLVKKYFYIPLLVIAILLVFLVFFSPIFKESSREMAQLKGNYIFEKWLYLTVLSSQSVPDGYVEYYTFTEDTLIMTDADGNQKEFPITYQKIEVSPEAFAEDFSPVEPGPDISGYQSCYLLTDDEGSYPYRVYAMDHEIWLAYFQTKYVTNTKGPTEKVSQIWSVYQIVPYDGEIPS